jgi:hypothetical protein
MQIGVKLVHKQITSFNVNHETRDLYLGELTTFLSMIYICK